MFCASILFSYCTEQHDTSNGIANGCNGTLRVPQRTLQRHSPLCAVFSAPIVSQLPPQPMAQQQLLENPALVGLLQRTSDPAAFPLLQSQDSFNCALSSIV